jgi:hypothetical protein
MAFGRIEMTQIVTKRFPLNKALEAMEFASKEKDAHAKVMIKPSE